MFVIWWYISITSLPMIALLSIVIFKPIQSQNLENFKKILLYVPKNKTEVQELRNSPDISPRLTLSNKNFRLTSFNLLSLLPYWHILQTASQPSLLHILLETATAFVFEKKWDSIDSKQPPGRTWLLRECSHVCLLALCVKCAAKVKMNWIKTFSWKEKAVLVGRENCWCALCVRNRYIAVCVLSFVHKWF